MAVAEVDQFLEEAVNRAWRDDAAEVSFWSPFRSRSVTSSHKHNHGEHKCHEWSCSRCHKNELFSLRRLKTRRVIGFNPVIHVTQECFSPCLHPAGGFSTTTKDVPMRILLAVLPETTLVPAKIALCFMFQVANPPEEIILFNEGGEALPLCNLRYRERNVCSMLSTHEKRGNR